MRAESCREWRESLGAYALGHLAADERARRSRRTSRAAPLAAPRQSPLPRSRGCCRLPTRPASARRRAAAGAGRSRRRDDRRRAQRGRRRRRAPPRLGAERRDRRRGSCRAGDLRPPGRRAAADPSSTSPFTRLPPGVRIAATLEPHAFGTEIHMYVSGVRSGTLCRVFLRGPNGARVSGRHLPLPLRRRRPDACSSSALDLSRTEAIGVRAGSRTFIAPVDGGKTAVDRQLESGGQHVTRDPSRHRAAGARRRAGDRRLRQQQQQQLSQRRAGRLRIGRQQQQRKHSLHHSSGRVGAATRLGRQRRRVGQVLVDSERHDALLLPEGQERTAANPPATAPAPASGRHMTTSGCRKASGGAVGIEARHDPAHRRHHAGDLRRLAALHLRRADKKPGEDNGTDSQVLRRLLVPATPERREGRALSALTAGTGRGNQLADLGQEPDRELPRVLAGLGLAAGRLEEADPHLGRRREAW